MLEMLRQDRIFDRAEEGRLDAGQEHGKELQPDLVGEQAEGRERHDAISMSLMRRASMALSNLSASWPAVAEKRKKGRISRPAESVLSKRGIEAEPRARDRR